MLVSFDDLLNLPQVRVLGAVLTETEITLQLSTRSISPFATSVESGQRSSSEMEKSFCFVICRSSIARSFWCCKPNAIAACIAVEMSRPLNRDNGMTLKLIARQPSPSFSCWS